jgi:hypothetical protein
VGIELYEFVTQHFMKLHDAAALSSLQTLLESRMCSRCDAAEEEYRPAGYPILFLRISVVPDC